MYNSDIAQFDPIEWTEERFKDLLPCLNQSRIVTSEDIANEQKRNDAIKKRNISMVHLHKVHDDCVAKLEDIQALGRSMESLRMSILL